MPDPYTKHTTFADGWDGARQHYLQDGRRDLEDVRGAVLSTVTSYRDSYQEALDGATPETAERLQYAAQVSLLNAVIESLTFTLENTIKHARVTTVPIEARA